MLEEAADPAGSLLVRREHCPLVEAGAVDEVTLDDFVDAAAEDLEKASPVLVAVLIEPDAVEPRLKRQLKDVGEPLVRVGERLHIPRSWICVPLVSTPRGDVPDPGVAQNAEAVRQSAQAAVVAERRADAD